MITVETDDSPGVLGLVVFSTIFLLSLFFNLTTYSRGFRNFSSTLG